ncbi:78 kDa glucose-regulated protein homolog [Rhizoctonia solani]|uniref:Immunoglobulin heavy chain-binding protein homolog n=1 Tax=Rhizoctonia solani TaxID=456999 RepID=A0A0K6GHA6_9AGAM|nr:78 kDa glucose-regulated protein homolog [Rhizoctonia solani]
MRLGVSIPYLCLPTRFGYSPLHPTWLVRAVRVMFSYKACHIKPVRGLRPNLYDSCLVESPSFSYLVATPEGSFSHATSSANCFTRRVSILYRKNTGGLLPTSIPNAYSPNYNSFCLAQVRLNIKINLFNTDPYSVHSYLQPGLQKTRSLSDIPFAPISLPTPPCHSATVGNASTAQGDHFTPSRDQIGDDKRLIGEASRAAFHTSPAQTVFDTKHLIGCKYDGPEVKRDMMHRPCKIFNTGGKPKISVKDSSELNDVIPEEVSAMVLTKMKESAGAYLDKQVTFAIVTVPAHFNDAQWQGTKDTGTIAGLTVLCIVDKPTTGAVTHGHDQETQIIVCHLSGETFDVSLLSIDDGVFKVLVTASDTHLGGKDFNNRVIEHFIHGYKKKTGTDVTKNQHAVSKLKKEVETATHTLSSQMSTKLEIESFENGNDFSETLTRSKFEELNIDLFCKTMKPVEQVLKDANVKKEDISDIVLVGGSTRIPKVQQLIKEYFGKECSKGINPNKAFAYGAVIQGGIPSGKKGVENVVLADISPLTLGIETTGGVFTTLIPCNTVVPTEKSQIFSTAANNQPTVLMATMIREYGMPERHTSKIQEIRFIPGDISAIFVTEIKETTYAYLNKFPHPFPRILTWCTWEYRVNDTKAGCSRMRAVDPPLTTVSDVSVWFLSTFYTCPTTSQRSALPIVEQSALAYTICDSSCVYRQPLVLPPIAALPARAIHFTSPHSNIVVPRYQLLKLGPALKTTPEEFENATGSRSQRQGTVGPGKHIEGVTEIHPACPISQPPPFDHSASMTPPDCSRSPTRIWGWGSMYLESTSHARKKDSELASRRQIYHCTQAGVPHSFNDDHSFLDN